MADRAVRPPLLTRPFVLLGAATLAFFVQGGTVRLMEPWRMGAQIEREDRWTIDDLARDLPGILA